MMVRCSLASDKTEGGVNPEPMRVKEAERASLWIKNLVKSICCAREREIPIINS